MNRTIKHNLTHKIWRKHQIEITKITMYNLKIVHHNIRSLNVKINELKLFIYTQPDIITLNETLTIKPSLKIPNYTITQPQNNIDKGVAIIYRNNINTD